MFYMARSIYWVTLLLVFSYVIFIKGANPWWFLFMLLIASFDRKDKEGN